jgi:putative ABC transport system permease protein
MGTIIANLNYAARSLRKSPGFTVVAVLTLALGIGANSAVFSLINAVLLRPLPYHQPDRLVLVWESAPFFGLHDSPVAPANFVDWKARSHSFTELGALEDRSFRLTGEGTPEILQGGLVTAGFLRALGSRLQLGRGFRDEEDQPGAARVVVISDAFWRTRFGGDTRVLGKTLTLNDEKHTIVGVLAPGGEPPAEYAGRFGELWAPFGTAYTAEGWAARGRHNWMVLGRLDDGASLASANAEMASIGRSLAKEYPDTNEQVGVFVAPLRDHYVRENRTILALLLGTVVFILLIACCNLANLLLARAAHRAKEVAVRAALGASMWQLARQFFFESLLLCGLGTALGLPLASLTFQFLAHLAPEQVNGLKDVAVDWRVLAFTLGIAALTTVAFGLAPLWLARRVDVSHALKQSARTLAVSAGSGRLRGLLIYSQVALACMLLIGAGLLIRTFAHLRGVDPGFRTANLLTLSMPPSKEHRGAERSIAYQREILRRVTSLPGVESAGFTNHIPIAFKYDMTSVGAEGRDPKDRVQARAREAGPGYLRTMGIPLVAGRDVNERDVAGAPYVALVNQAMARQLFPGKDPIGQKLLFSRDVQVRVIGVVGDIRQSGRDSVSNPEFYVSTLQSEQPPGALAIRTRVDPGSLAQAVRQTIWAVDPDQPVTNVATMDEILDREVFQRRVQTTLLSVFAGLALLLAGVGLYGVLAYQVGLQTPEIGLRMALGAAPVNVLRRILSRAVWLTAAGAASGAVGALAMSRLMSRMLVGVKATDPATYVAVMATMLVVAVAAACLPARRAMRVDPIVALREE